MTNSCVAFVSFTIFVRSVDESWLGFCACLLRPCPCPFVWEAAKADAGVGVELRPLTCAAPRVLRECDSWMTV